MPAPVARSRGSTATDGSDFRRGGIDSEKRADELLANVPNYQHHAVDIPDAGAFTKVFKLPRSCLPPRVGEIYNIGESRHSNCSMLEAIEPCEEISGRKLSWSMRGEPQR